MIQLRTVFQSRRFWCDYKMIVMWYFLSITLTDRKVETLCKIKISLFDILLILYTINSVKISTKTICLNFSLIISLFLKCLNLKKNLNLMPATWFKQSGNGTKVVQQVNRFTGNRWQHQDCLWKRHPWMVQLFTSKCGKRFSNLWKTSLYKDITT